MENKGGGFWVALPQKEVTIDGERKWVDLLQLGRDEQDFLNRQVVGQLRQRGDLPGGRQQGPAPLRRSSERDHEPGLEDYFPQAQDDDVDF